MIIRMKVESLPLTISAIEVEMPGTPREQCRETIDSLKPIAGMQIVAGFTAAVKEKVGGRKGCAHLTALLIAMAPAAVQGFWANHAQNPVKDDIQPEAVHQFLVNTCRGGLRGMLVDF